MKLLESMADNESGLTIAERPKNNRLSVNNKSAPTTIKTKNDSATTLNNNNNITSNKELPAPPSKDVKTNGVVNIDLSELNNTQNTCKVSNGHRSNGHRNYNQNNNYCSFPNHFYQNQPNNRRNNYHRNHRNNHHRGASPNHSTGSTSSGGSSRYTPSPQSQSSGHGHHSPRVNSPNYHHRYKDCPANQQIPTIGGGQMGGSSMQQHVVHLHVNPGEAISFQMGDQLQLINGPATVRMVSNNNTPPIPMPVQVPPGHMVQQIVDETGTLRHVILSPQPLAMQMGSHNPYSNQSTVNGGESPGSASPANHYYNYPTCTTSSNGYPNPQFHHIPMQPPGSLPHQSRSNNMASPTSHSNGSNGNAKPCPHHPNPSHNQSGPLHNHKDERTQKQFHKLRKKLDARQKDSPIILTHNNNSIPSSPKKEAKKFKDRNTSTSGLEDDSNVPSPEDEEEQKMLTELLSQISQPTVDNIESRSVHLSWSGPNLCNEQGDNKYVEFDIKQSDFHYEIQLLSDKSKDTKYKVAYKGGDLECDLHDLRPATDYHSRLQAFLDDLQGQVSESVMFRTEPSQPDAPNPPKLCSRTKTSLSLKWNPPCDNGSKITNYILECDSNNSQGFVEVFNGSSKQYKVSKLTTSTCYRFRLSCLNQLGKSEYSDVVSFSTSGSVPNQPASPGLVTASTNKLSLSWLKRPNDEDFTLQIEEEEGANHGFLPVYNGSECSYTCTGLIRNTSYKFRLSANNEEGSSRWSDIAKYTTLPDRPCCPGKPYAKGRVHSTSFKVSWDAPKDDGGSSVKCYYLELDEGSGNGPQQVYSDKDVEYVCDQLKPGTVYKLRVSCSSEGGQSDFSEAGCITTMPVSPGQCAIPKLNGKPKAHSLQLKWVYPNYDGGTTVTEYEVDMTNPDNSSRSVYKGHDTECVVAGLLPGRPYIFRVRAFNRIGAGEWSDSMEAVSGAGVPENPKEVNISFRSAQHALISWEEPLNNGAAITEYRLEWSQHEGSQDFVHLYTGHNLQHEFKGLQPATVYNFRIQAVNSAGASGFSGVSSGTSPASSPAAVSSSSLRATYVDANSCKLCWHQPSNNGADITAYNIEISCNASVKTVTVQSPVATEYMIHNLHPLTSYRVRVQAVNSVGVGPFNSALKVTTKPLPPLPPKLELITSTHNTLKMRWTSDIKQNSIDLIQYYLEMQTKQGSFVPVYVGSNHLYKVSKLTEDTEYVFRIYASNEAGHGPCSDNFVCTTCKAPPPAPKAPRVTSVTEASCCVDWMAVSKPMSSDDFEYQLQLLTNQVYKTIYRGVDTNYTIDGLKGNSEYSVRVNAIRIFKDGSGELNGAFSQSSSFSTASKEPSKASNGSNGSSSASSRLTSTLQSSTLAAIVTDRKPLTDQQWAVLILLCFTVFAIFVAIILQRVIAYNAKAPS